MKKQLIISIIFLIGCVGMMSGQSIADFAKSKNLQTYKGYMTFYRDLDNGTVYLEIEKWEKEFLYVNSLAAGVGSNDLGLDRGQLGNERIVKFNRVGNKVLLIQPNYRYRAVSTNPEEIDAVEQAFAQSVLWGFPIVAKSGNRVLVEATNFLFRDAHGISSKLRNQNQGNYNLDQSRTALYSPRTNNFPKNTEFEVILTFVGEAKGGQIRSVTPSSDAVTVRMHHSFIKLPDNKYEPREFDPRAGFFNITYSDYASPISAPLQKRFITRHRLVKKESDAVISEPVEPIIYYLDRGAPEPIRSALLEGASWWNEAFEELGFKDAFIVKLLPIGADPMDVRYNVIQWVHRSTRGWSYGSSVIDPRTGEIIKGHVSLGSLRVRQDFLIAQGLLSPYEKGEKANPKMEEMALARLRQLSAHEVGHTLGLAHNFAASVNDRASVMDYPHPFIALDKKGELDFSEAYDTKIGSWDKQAIAYGYSDFPEGTNEKEALQNILNESKKKGLYYLSDSDARPKGSAHPLAHLWDNSANPTKELERILALRADGLQRFGLNSISEGTPIAVLEDVLAPLYLGHRYQVEATAKLIGGVYYTYAVKGENDVTLKYVDKETETEALKVLLRTIQPEVLKIPKSTLSLLLPKPPGYGRGRENFTSKTGVTFDYLSAAESAAAHTIDLLLNAQRASRMIENHALENEQLSFHELLELLMNTTWRAPLAANTYDKEIQRMVQRLVLHNLMRLSINERANGQARAFALLEIEQLENVLQQKIKSVDTPTKAHYLLALMEIAQFKKDPNSVKMTKPARLPDGSPIGCH